MVAKSSISRRRRICLVACANSMAHGWPRNCSPSIWRAVMYGLPDLLANPASAARIAKEDANRKQLADGALGLDMYGLRQKLDKVDYISYAEYVRRAGEGV